MLLCECSQACDGHVVNDTGVENVYYIPEAKMCRYPEVASLLRSIHRRCSPMELELCLSASSSESQLVNTYAHVRLCYAKSDG